MFKLIKWSLIGAIAVGAAGYFMLGDHFGSYVGTIGSSMREKLKSNIPIEFEIKRAEKLIRQIEPEVKECHREVAGAEVELENLVRAVNRLEKTVAKQEQKLKEGSKHLTNAETSSYEPGERYSRRRIEMDLSRTFEIFKNNKVMLKAKKALIERQSQAVSASRIKLDSVRTRQAELQSTIAGLKVQKKHLDALAASNRRFDLDDSALAKATEVLNGVKKRLDITQKMIENDMYFAEGITDDASPRRDIVKEIDQHFAETPAPAKELSVRRGALRPVIDR